jgi:hypothetical protein
MEPMRAKAAPTRRKKLIVYSSQADMVFPLFNF